MRFVLVAVVLVIATPARAEPSPTTATLLSAGGTLLPTGGYLSIPYLPERAKKPVFIASTVALLVAPSAGQFYAGEPLSTGFAIRIGGGAVFGLGMALLGTSRDGDGREHVDRIIGGLVLGAAGFVTMGLGALHDVGTARSIARDARVMSFGGRF